VHLQLLVVSNNWGTVQNWLSFSWYCH